MVNERKINPYSPGGTWRYYVDFEGGEVKEGAILTGSFGKGGTKMKREILFRGKRIFNGEWIEGDIWTMPNDGLAIVVDGNQKCFSKDFNPIPVDPSTIGQFTGLTDKNGTKIFEGDKVKYTKHPGYTLASFESVIIYDSKVAAFAIEGFPANIYFCDLHELQEDLLNHLEVVE